MLTNNSNQAAHQLAAQTMIRVVGGDISLRDEGKKRNWAVTVKPFEIARVPVTRELYQAVTGTSSPASLSAQTPQTEVSWNDAVAFCNRLSDIAGLTKCYKGMGPVDAEDVTCDFQANGYRLPTEAEWEFACRAESPDVRYGPLDEIAWFRENAGDVIHDVALKRPNAWGLYDTIGNAWEWCWDVYDASVYGPYRVFRGGGYADLPRGCRASCRRKSHPTFAVEDVSFRLARSV